VDEKRQRRGWFVAAAALLAVDMYGVAETLANRIPRQEYVGAVPALAIVPWFFAGSLFAITALPAFLTLDRQDPSLDARARPHALRAARRWRRGSRGHLGHEQHNRHGLTQPGRRRRLAAAFTAISVRTFTRSAVG
jgi:hypothetical protein